MTYKPMHKLQKLLLLGCLSLSIPLLAEFHVYNGDHNGESCTAENSSGTIIRSSCANRATICNDDANKTCTISGNASNNTLEIAKDEMLGGDGGASNPTTPSAAVGVAAEAAQTKDHSSGMATGKRTYEPLTIRKRPGARSSDSDTDTEKMNHDSAESVIHRDIATKEKGSGMPTGKRLHKPAVMTNDNGDQDSATPATHKRIDKASPLVKNNAGDLNSDDGDDDSTDGDDSDGDNADEKATDYNSSRSNKNSNH